MVTRLDTKIIRYFQQYAEEWQKMMSEAFMMLIDDVATNNGDCSEMNKKSKTIDDGLHLLSTISREFNPFQERMLIGASDSDNNAIAIVIIDTLIKKLKTKYQTSKETLKDLDANTNKSDKMQKYLINYIILHCLIGF